MYAHCIACFSSLGRNERIESFPIGRRVAFDSAKGRLWVVCIRCGQWNLTPLEERWEAFDVCETLFTSTSIRASTDHIGLAQLSCGLQLIRVGRPLKPEFAAWRYGARFRRRAHEARRAKAYAAGAYLGATSLFGVGVAFGLPPFLSSLVGLPILSFAGWAHYRAMRGSQISESKRALTYVWARAGNFNAPRKDRDAEALANLLNVFLVPVESGNGWALRLKSLLDSFDFVEDEALRLAHVALPAVNSAGLRRSMVQRAVLEIERVGDPRRYFPHVLSQARSQGLRYSPLHSYPAPIRLALEMAAHDIAERHLIEGELRFLENAWQEAEEIAAIADSLLIPPPIGDGLHALRREAAARTQAAPEA